MGIRRLVTGAALVAIVALLGLSIFRAITAGPADVPRQQELENAQRQASAPSTGPDFRQPLGSSRGISGQGIVEPADREVKVGSRVPGLVQKIWVKEGDQVAEGAPLLDLASGAETAAVAAARADLEAAIARSSISSLTAKRAEDLAKDGLVSRDERDRSVSQASIDRAGVDQARSRLSEAQARLAQLKITAPSAGTILKLSVRAGEYYSPEGGASLVTLGNLSTVRVRLDIDERFIGSVFVGQPGYVVVEAYDRKFPGKVVEIAQRMGRKNQRTDDPTERIDTKIREVVLELEDAKDLVPGLRAIGHLADTTLETSFEVASARKGDAPPALDAPRRQGGLGAVEATASVTTAPRPATAEEWERWGASLLRDRKHRQAVAVYREAVVAHPSLRARVAGLVGQYRNADPELAFCLDPSDKGLAAAWAKAATQRRSLCAESR